MSHPLLTVVVRQAVAIFIAAAIIIIVIKVIDRFTTSQTSAVKTIPCHQITYVPPDEPKPGKAYFCPEE